MIYIFVKTPERNNTYLFLSFYIGMLGIISFRGLYSNLEKTPTYRKGFNIKQLRPDPYFENFLLTVEVLKKCHQKFFVISPFSCDFMTKKKLGL